MIDEIYTIQDVAEKLKVNERYVRDNLSNGKLKGYKRGKRVYVLHSELIEFVKAGKDTTSTK